MLEVVGEHAEVDRVSVYRGMGGRSDQSREQFISLYMLRILYESPEVLLLVLLVCGGGEQRGRRLRWGMEGVGGIVWFEEGWAWLDCMPCLDCVPPDCCCCCTGPYRICVFDLP